MIAYAARGALKGALLLIIIAVYLSLAGEMYRRGGVRPLVAVLVFPVVGALWAHREWKEAASTSESEEEDGR